VNIDGALARAYADALYVIEMPDGPVTRRIGRIDAQADARLRTHGCCRHWWIVTPCNPRSRPVSGRENDARLERFAQELRQHGWRTLPSHNTAADGRWYERGFCIFDAEADAITDLARRYEQNAIVGAELGAAPMLHWQTQP
jgi:hypothetical protein